MAFFLVEAFQIIEVAAGDGFVFLNTKEGKVFSWGRNEFGQLGNGNREKNEKPRLVDTFFERLLQISAGSQHVIALTVSGNILSWGGNRLGQLGDGQFTSNCVPRIINQLRHRPVVGIACGENHTLVVTVTGNLFAWGDNANGQLGLGDSNHRCLADILNSESNTLI